MGSELTRWSVGAAERVQGSRKARILQAASPNYSPKRRSESLRRRSANASSMCAELQHKLSNMDAAQLSPRQKVDLVFYNAMNPFPLV
jgi:hypothetical protein